MPTKIDIHEKLCTQMHELYVKKNADYGDSFAKVREEIPDAILVRLSDKLNRLKSLMQNPDKQRVQNESIDDTLMDLANYCLLELVERQYKNDRTSDDALSASKQASEIEGQIKTLFDLQKFEFDARRRDVNNLKSDVRTHDMALYDLKIRVEELERKN